MHVATESASDRHAVREVVGSAFGDQGAQVVGLVEMLRVSGHLRASLVARDVDTVVGYLALSRSWIDARARLVEVLVLSPLAVLPGRQRTGIGTALVAAARDRALALGVPALFLEGDPAYYSRHGYVPGVVHGFSRPSVRIPESAFQTMLLPSHEPWIRGALIYPDPFWVCDAVGLRDPLLARRQGGRTEPEPPPP